MLPPFRIVERLRPVAVVQHPPAVERVWADGAGPAAWSHPAPAVAPYAAVEIGLREAHPARSEGWLRFGWRSDTGPALVGWCEPGGRRTGLAVTDRSGSTRELHSRRFGRLRGRPARLALCLTGTALSLLSSDGASAPWTARARFDVPPDLLDVHDEGVLAGLTLTLTSAGDGRPEWLRAGGFGQLGLRDLHTVTTPDGDVVRHEGGVLVAATSAGPGFFPTAHTSLWRFDTTDHDLRHLSDVYFRRSPTPAARARSVRRSRRDPASRSGPGVFGDHGTQVIRDDDRWLVLTSSWGDFAHQGVRILTSTTTADLTRGTHVLDAAPLPLPTTDPGAWDPHLMRIGHEWVLAYVAAARFFDHHPVLARGPSLERLRLVGADLHRHATEGVVLVRPQRDGAPVLLASDGRPGARRGGPPPGFAVFDLTLRQRGTLDAPYPTNLPWPNVWPEGEGWLMLTFNGARAAGRLAGYGTHGDVVVMRADP